MCWHNGPCSAGNERGPDFRRKNPDTQAMSEKPRSSEKTPGVVTLKRAWAVNNSLGATQIQYCHDVYSNWLFTRWQQRVWGRVWYLQFLSFEYCYYYHYYYYYWCCYYYNHFTAPWTVSRPTWVGQHQKGTVSTVRPNCFCGSHCRCRLTTMSEIYAIIFLLMPSVLWRCWLGIRKGIRPVKTEWWGAGVVICLWCRFAYGPADATATHCLLLQ